MAITRALALFAVLSPAPALAQIESLPPPPLYSPTPTPPPPGQQAAPQQQPAYAQPGTMAYVGPGRQPPPPFRVQWGLGVRGTMAWYDYGPSAYLQGGVGLEVLTRLSARVTLEISGQYQRALHDDLGLDRMSVPVVLGLRMHLAPQHYVTSPYLVLGAGVNYTRLMLPELYEQAWYGELQGGGGIELRPARNFALNLDLRLIGRLRVDRAEPLVLQDDLGHTLVPNLNHYGFQVNAGIARYF
jgi:hypothetical protein